MFEGLEKDSVSVGSDLRGNIFCLIFLNALEINASYGFIDISNNNEYLKSKDCKHLVILTEMTHKK